MKSTKYIFFYLLIINFNLAAQDSPVEYMSTLGDIYHDISKDTWDYIKQASKGRNARKIEKRRIELVTTLKSAKYKATKMGSYKGDKSLRDAAVNYLNISYLSLNNDYKKIVDLEAIAEESYDAMEAYLMAKERVNAKMDSISEKLKNAETAFASANNINLTDSKTKLSRKLNNAAVVNTYYNKVYLVFFKSYWYEQQMVLAQSAGKISDIEQYRQSLELYSTEGMEELKSIGLFRGDRTLKEACYSMLTFYKSEAVKYVPNQIDFFVKNEKMKTTVKNFEGKSKKSLTQEDVDEYNKAINENNKAIENFNSTNEYLNNNRTKKINTFNKSVSDFYNKYL